MISIVRLFAFSSHSLPFPLAALHACGSGRRCMRAISVAHIASTVVAAACEVVWFVMWLWMAMGLEFGCSPCCALHLSPVSATYYCLLLCNQTLLKCRCQRRLNCALNHMHSCTSAPEVTHHLSVLQFPGLITTWWRNLYGRYASLPATAASQGRAL